MSALEETKYHNPFRQAHVETDRPVGRRSQLFVVLGPLLNDLRSLPHLDLGFGSLAHLLVLPQCHVAGLALQKNQGVMREERRTQVCFGSKPAQPCSTSTSHTSSMPHVRRAVRNLGPTQPNHETSDVSCARTDTDSAGKHAAPLPRSLTNSLYSSGNPSTKAGRYK